MGENDKYANIEIPADGVMILEKVCCCSVFCSELIPLLDDCESLELFNNFLLDLEFGTHLLLKPELLALLLFFTWTLKFLLRMNPLLNEKATGGAINASARILAKNIKRNPRES